MNEIDVTQNDSLHQSQAIRKMFSNAKIAIQLSAVGIVVTVAAVFGVTASADGGGQPFKVGATDMAAGGLEVAEYPSAAGAASDWYNEVGETDQAGEENTSQIERSPLRSEPLVKAGFTDMAGGGLPAPDEYRFEPRYVYLGLGETDEAGGIVELVEGSDGLVFALLDEDDSTGTFVLLRTPLDPHAAQSI